MALALFPNRVRTYSRKAPSGMPSWKASPRNPWRACRWTTSRPPEFLDRIVEGRLQAIEEQLGEVRGRQQRMRWVRRGSLALSAALVLMLVPWGNLAQDRQATPLPLVQYSSLEGMQSAFPDQMRFVSESGEFGAVLSAPSETSNGVKASKPERVR